MENLTTHQPKKRAALSKKSIHVDMTPMVDLAFLLITFFMFTMSFTKPKVIDLGLPAGEGGTEINIKNQLTFILGKDDRVFYYQKELQDFTANDIKETAISGTKISKLITTYKNAAPDIEKFTIIIKPTDDAKYRNFVDMLDEMAMTNIERYGISDLKQKEEKIYAELTK